jgi:aldose 1-epimerase
MREPAIREQAYGTLPDGRRASEWTLDNGKGLVLRAIPLGGIVTALDVPDRHGVAANVVLALPSLADYAGAHPHLGTIVGRFANRIAGARFRLDGAEHLLAANDGPNCLHGGTDGFGRQWWDMAPLPPMPDGSVALELSRTSPDGEQGFPGRLDVRVRYTLTPAQEWRIDYRATCDRATVVNLSHHDYFNLAGQGSVMDHVLQVAADAYCPVDSALIPEGIAGVDGTPFDFRRPTRIGERIRALHPQLLRLAARLHDPASGRSMEVLTTEPGLQFYSGNFLDGTLAGAHGQALRQGDGLCLETQHYPDAPNQPAFPPVVLRPGETYSSTTVHRFGIAD